MKHETRTLIRRDPAIQDRTERSKTSGYVYFIACGPYIKIGYSLERPRDRLRAMETGNPYPCELVGMLKGGMPLERELQKRFASTRHVREWFHSTPDLLAFIAEACGDWGNLDRAVHKRVSEAERREEMGRNTRLDFEDWYSPDIRRPSRHPWPKQPSC